MGALGVPNDKSSLWEGDKVIGGDITGCEFLWTNIDMATDHRRSRFRRVAGLHFGGESIGRGETPIISPLQPVLALLPFFTVCENFSS